MSKDAIRKYLDDLIAEVSAIYGDHLEARGQLLMICNRILSDCKDIRLGVYQEQEHAIN